MLWFLLVTLSFHSFGQTGIDKWRYDAYDGIPEAGVSKLLFDQIGRPVLVDSMGQIFVLRSGKFKRAPGLPSSLKIRQILTGPEKLLWLIDEKGLLFSFDPTRYILRNYYPVSSITGKISALFASGERLFIKSGIKVFEIYSDNKGTLPVIHPLGELPLDTEPFSMHLNGRNPWILDTIGRIWEYDSGKQIWAIPDDLKAERIRSLCIEDSVLTYIERDSFIKRRLGGKVAELKLSQGLLQPFSRILSASEDRLWLIGHYGIYWMSTQKDSLFTVGYFKLDPEKDHIVDFSGGDDPTLWIYAEGILHAPSKAAMKRGLKLPETNLERVFSPDITGKVIISGNGNIEVYGSDIGFSFSNLDSNLTFRYKLDGKRTFGWSLFKRDGDIIFKDLPPGRYALTIEVVHPSGQKKSHEYSFRVISDLWLNLPRWLLVGSLLILVTLVLVLVYQYIQRKREIQKMSRMQDEIKQLETEMKSLQLQINPHFIFNFLSGINGLIHMGKAEKAAKYIGMASGVMRKLLDSSRQKWHPLSVELELMREYVTIENFRTGKNIAFRVFGNVGDDIFIPPLFLQPLIENAMQHAFKGRKTGTIQVQIEERGGFLQFKVKDSGTGLRDERDADGIHALQIIEERLRLYIRDLPVKVLSIKSEKGSGTEIVFLLPYKRMLIHGT